MTPVMAMRLEQTGHDAYELHLDPTADAGPLELAVVVTVRSTDNTNTARRLDSSSWTPPTATGQDHPTLTPYEHALSILVTAENYGRYGRSLIHGLMHCEPRAVIAAANAVRAALSSQG